MNNKYVDIYKIVFDILKEFKNSYIISIDFNSDGNKRCIYYPSFSKVKFYCNNIRYIVLTSSVENGSIKYVIFNDGKIKFSNNFENVNIEYFKNKLFNIIENNKDIR